MQHISQEPTDSVLLVSILHNNSNNIIGDWLHYKNRISSYFFGFDFSLIIFKEPFQTVRMFNNKAPLP